MQIPEKNKVQHVMMTFKFVYHSSVAVTAYRRGRASAACWTLQRYARVAASYFSREACGGP